MLSPEFSQSMLRIDYPDSVNVNILSVTNDRIIENKMRYTYLISKIKLRNNTYTFQGNYYFNNIRCLRRSIEQLVPYI